MTKLLTIIAAFLISSTCFAQQLKTYSGNYDLNSNYANIFSVPTSLLKGNATYTYFEDENLRRIRSGNFNYNGKISNNGTSLTTLIMGSYSNDEKNGNWTVKSSIVTGNGQGGSQNFNGNFKKGYPNGLWSVAITSTEGNESYSMVFIC